MGFLKFALLASLGELISFRFSLGAWAFPRGFFYKVFLWGFVGLFVAFSFEFYSAGVKGLLQKGKLPFGESQIAFAFFTSLLNNLTFAPLMMSFHKFWHTYIDLNFERKTSLEKTLDSISWKNFLGFICLKKIPFFWIPVHTLTFLLPEAYRVLFASFLSLVLGVLLTA